MAAAGRGFISAGYWPSRKTPLCRRTNVSFFSDSLARRNQRVLACAASDAQYRIKEEGRIEDVDYRVFLTDGSGRKISPWHDIPLELGDGIFNCVVEIPKDTNLRMELATCEQFNPITQDKRGGILRCNMSWNYGLLPQTWEDPSYANLDVEGALGDNDPVDVIEIGSSSVKVGEVLKVKPLATLALIDEGKLDWKIIAISLNDARASLVHDVDDIDNYFPGTLGDLSKFFRDYKMIYNGVVGNKYGLGNKPANKEYAVKVIMECKEAWNTLVRRANPASYDLSLG